MTAMPMEHPVARPRLRAAVPPPPVPARPRLIRLAAAAAAMAGPRGPVVALPPFRTVAAARAWLDAQLPALLAVPDPGFARRLAPVLADYLEATGRHHEAAELVARALVDGGGPADRLRPAGAAHRIGRDAAAGLDR